MNKSNKSKEDNKTSSNHINKKYKDKNINDEEDNIRMYPSQVSESISDKEEHTLTKIYIEEEDKELLIDSEGNLYDLNEQLIGKANNFGERCNPPISEGDTDQFDNSNLQAPSEQVSLENKSKGNSKEKISQTINNQNRKFFLLSLDKFILNDNEDYNYKRENISNDDDSLNDRDVNFNIHHQVP